MDQDLNSTQASSTPGSLRIEAAELHMVRLEPQTLRTDAIQAFVAQETPILRLRMSDGSENTLFRLKVKILLPT